MTLDEFASALDDLVREYHNGLMHNFGETHYAAKLNDEDIKEIRRLASSGKMLHREIAAIFGVKRQAIGKIVNGLSWRRVS